MPGTLNTRVTSLEESMRRAFTAIEALTEKEKKLDDVLVLLTEAQIATQQSFEETERRFQETERRFQETDRRFQETDKRFQETDKRFRETDARIDKLVESQMQTDERFRQTGERIDNLVSAIGALLRSRPI
jgi:chromosome segregation ATPase